MNVRRLLWSVSIPAIGASTVGCDLGGPPPKPPNDVTFCDIKVNTCTSFEFDPSTGLAVGCDSVALETVSPTYGFRDCFNASQQNPDEACQSYCNAHFAEPTVLYPVGATGCVGTVDTSPQHSAFGYSKTHEELNECSFQSNPTFESVRLPLTGTNTVTLVGTSSVTYSGTSSTVAINNGYINLEAPNQSCVNGAANCPTQINSAEIDFADFVLGGQTVQGLTLALNFPSVAPSGAYDVASNRFVFSIPTGTSFDASAILNGAKTGLTVVSNQEVLGSIDLATGKVVFQFSVMGNFLGKAFSASGTAVTNQVIDVAPVVTAPATVTATATSSCTASVTLTANASSTTAPPSR
jgi:hypothetical protein